MSSSLSRHRPQHLRLVENLLRRRGRSYYASSSSAFFWNSDHRTLSPDWTTTTTTTTLHRHPQQQQQQQQQHRLFQYYENSTTRATRHRQQHDRSITMFSTYCSHLWWHRHQQRSYCYFSSTPIRHSAEEVTVPPAAPSSSSSASAPPTSSSSSSSKPQQTKLKPPPSPSSSNHDATSSKKIGKKNSRPRQQHQPKDKQATNNSNNNNNKKLNNKKLKATTTTTTTTRKYKDDAAAVAAAAPPQLLQLRNVHARDTIEFHFEQVAMRTELSKLKFISKLRDKLLVLQVQQEEHEQESSANSSSSSNSNQNGVVADADDDKSQNKNKKSTTTTSPSLSYWKVTQQYLDGRKSVPTHVKNAFWNLIVAPTHKKKNKKFPSEAIAAKDIEVLVEAREASVQQPLFWNHKHKHQVSKQLVVEAAAAEAEGNLNTNKKQLQKDMLAEYLATRSKRISDLHHGTKSSKARTDEARQMAQTLRSHLPPSYYQKLLTKLKEYVKQQQQQQQQQLQAKQSPTPETTAPAPTTTGTEGQQKTPTSFSASSLHTSAHTHFHLIAPILMDFFYLTLGDSDSGSDSEPTDQKDGDKSDANLEDKQTFDEYGSTTTILSSDATLQSAEEAWREAREEFVSAFQTIQTILVEEHEHMFSQQTGSASDVAAVSAVDQEQDDALNDEIAVVDWSINDDDDDDADELGEVFGEDDDDDGFDAEGDETEERVYDASEESVMATFEEAIKVLPGNEAAKATLLKPRHYIVFEAISVGDLSANPQEPHLYQSTNALEQASEVAKAAAAIQAAPTDQLVFIDNLPIDISENTLMDAYSRCGPIEAIQIHHQRPDLDPGRKSEDSKKKIRKPSRARMTWQRPRTPLYGTILFRDPAGAQKATVDPLRIFGMVLDKHLIRSYRASDMTKLYLEDISKQHDITYIEYQLSQILHPSLYVCLDIERRRQKKIRGPSSCEIKFPDFESAHWAYTKLSADLDLLKENDDCGLHWMPTPREAVLYWTRHLNF